MDRDVSGPAPPLSAEAAAHIHDFKLLADLSGVDLVVSDVERSRFVACNHSAHDHLGYSEAELLTLNPELIQADPDHDGAWVAARWQELLSAGSAEFTTRHRCKDGSVRLAHVSHRVVQLDGRSMIVSVFADDAQPNRTMHWLQESVDLLHDGESQSGIGTWDLRFSDGRVRWSRQTYRICQSDPSSFTPTMWGYGTLVHRDDRPRWRRELQRAINRGEPFQSRHRLAFLNGTETVVMATGEVIYDDAGNPQRVVGTIRDVSRDLSSNQEVEQARLIDPLTHLPNKLATQEELERRLQGRGYNDSLAVISLDIDGFQEINDNFGSDVGDQLLQAMAERLPALLGHQAWLARLSSDQFLVVLEEDIGSLGDAMARCRRLQVSWSNERNLVPNLDLRATFSIGLATYPEHGQSSSMLLQCANTALTEAKRGGRSQVCAYSTALSRQIHERMELSAELAQAMGSSQLRVMVQPQNHSSGALVGGEVLLRWTNRRGVQVPPCQFIPVAEESGLIFHLSDWTINRVLQRMRLWQDLALPVPRLSINVSPRQLEVPGRGFVSAILDTLHDHGLGAELLELEITETALMRNPLLAREQLRVLADQGFRIAIDDFGTGYSSLELLRTLPVHKLKIDRTFVQAVNSSPEDRAIVQATITLARGLGMDCIAEGVELEEQQRILQDLGCDLYQGYLYSKPLELDAFEQLLLQQDKGAASAVEQSTAPTHVPLHHLDSHPRMVPSTFEQLELLRTAIDSAQDNFLLMRSVDGPDGAVMDYLILEANQAACRYIQQEREAIVGQMLLGIFPQMQTNGLFDIFADASTRGTPLVVDDFVYSNHELLRNDRVYDIQLNPSREFLSVTWRDVTERHQAARSLAESAALYRLLAENIVEVVVLADDQQRIRWVSPSLEPMTGWTPEQWSDKHFSELFATAEGLPMPVDLDNWLNDYGDIRQGRLRLADPHEGWSWVELSVRHLHGHGLRESDPAGAGEGAQFNLKSGFVITLQPADELVLNERRLIKQASTDPLTGMESRGSILSWLNSHLDGHQGRKAQPLALLFCDFDDFKAINDTFGHAAGDAVLKTTAERLRLALRSHDHVGRLGGDEFLVVLDGVGNLNNALTVAEKLRSAVAPAIPWADRSIRPSLSIGVAIHAAGEDADLFLKRADRSMYAAKTAGRNQVMAAP